MTGYEFGDLVLVPFPFTNQSAVKRRPAVVISSTAYHRARPDILIIAVTSQQPSTLSVGEVQVQDWQGAGLLKPSVLKPVLTTIDPALVLKRLGRLTPSDQAAIRQALTTIPPFSDSPRTLTRTPFPRTWSTRAGANKSILMPEVARK